MKRLSKGQDHLTGMHNQQQLTICYWHCVYSSEIWKVFNKKRLSKSRLDCVMKVYVSARLKDFGGSSWRRAQYAIHDITADRFNIWWGEPATSGIGRSSAVDSYSGPRRSTCIEQKLSIVVPWDLAELHNFRLSVIQTQGNFSLFFWKSQDGSTV